ncbi:MAG TPA: hypothetical protein DCF61_04985 [Alphaproteobacteria bacterium]|nr:hypothetical protein [Alphaproteobacteria bacterium]
MPETVSIIPDPATLPPVSSIDVKAAYRARVGPINRAILFVLFYLPLTFSYSVYAAFIFIDDVFRIGLIVAGVVGDLLRYRFAPNVGRDWASAVSLFRDGVWSNEVEQAYTRWYCGWEKPFFIGIASYIAIFCIIRGLLPANLFNAYIDLFGPLHDLTRQIFVMASNHSSDLTNRGYEHLVGAVVHIEMLMALVIIATPFLICIGGSKWLTSSFFTPYIKEGEIIKWREDRAKIVKNLIRPRYIILYIFSCLFFGFFCIVVYSNMGISWNSCIKLRLCPQTSLIYFTIVITLSLLMFGGGSMIANILRLLVVTACIWDQQEAEAKGG